jgi:hypothetical protein
MTTELNEYRRLIGLDRFALEEALEPTVGSYLIALSSKLTQFDQRLSKGEMKRGGMANIYRLGHYMGALHKVEDAMKGMEKESSPEALDKLKKALAKAFEDDFPPLKAILKQIEKGKPSLVK